MEKVIYFLILICLICGCEVDAIVDSEHEPILQINAVIYNGEPLPIIEIKRTFNVPGKTVIILDSTEVLISGAEIELYHNKKAIVVKELSAGLYQPLSEELVQMGDIIEISVKKGTMSASAIATVPIITDNDITIDLVSDTVNLTVVYPYEFGYNEESQQEESYILDTLYFGYSTYRLTINKIPNYVALNMKGNIDSLFNYGIYHEYYYNENYIVPFGIDRQNIPYYGDHLKYRKDELVEIESIIVEENSFLIYDESDYNKIPKTGQTVDVSYEIIIPEDIYLDYLDIKSNYWAPITITNVKGGVGLFIGCYKDSGIKKKEVVVLKSPFQITPEEILNREPSGYGY